MSGYLHCAHVECFAIIIGKPGDLCDDCKAEHDAPSVSCAGCDNDSNGEEFEQ